MDTYDYGAEVPARFLEALAATGRIMESCDRAGWVYDAFRKRRDGDPAFAAAVENARARYREKLERTVELRGVDGWEEPVFHQGEICGTVRKFSDRLLELHVKRHIPEYRDKVSLDAEIRGGVFIVPTAGDAGAWTKKWTDAPGQEPPKVVESPSDE